MPQTKRNFTMQDGTDVEYEVLNIASAEEWLPAAAYTAVFEMPLPDGRRVRMPPMQGISFHEYEAIEAANPIPDSDTVSLEVRSAAVLKKQIAVFEKAFNSKIPGTNIEEKTAWLSKRSQGDAGVLFTYIWNTVLANGSNAAIDTYRLLALQGARMNVTEIASLSDWEEAANTSSVFAFSRPLESFVVEINMRNIPQETKLHIELNCKVPEPPLRAKINPLTKRRDPSIGTEPNKEDAQWMQKERAVMRRRLVLQLEAALPFAIPGNTTEEKHAWVAGRLVGDLRKIQDFVEYDLCGYSNRISSF